MRIHDENFLTIWTSDFNGLTHGLPLSILDLRFWILDCRIDQPGVLPSMTPFPFASYAFFAANLYAQ
jgi:hypothetical protein